jgi:hypothetical protein
MTTNEVVSLLMCNKTIEFECREGTKTTAQRMRRVDVLLKEEIRRNNERKETKEKEATKRSFRMSFVEKSFSQL